MTRVEENNAAILYITQILEIGPSPMQVEGLTVAALADISKSLAVIADATTEKQEESKNE